MYRDRESKLMCVYRAIIDYQWLYLVRLHMWDEDQTYGKRKKEKIILGFTVLIDQTNSYNYDSLFYTPFCLKHLIGVS